MMLASSVRVGIFVVVVNMLVLIMLIIVVVIVVIVVIHVHIEHVRVPIGQLVEQLARVVVAGSVYIAVVHESRRRYPGELVHV